MITIDKTAIIDAINFANDHPVMPDFYDLKDTIMESDLVLAITKDQAKLIMEALNELLNWLDTDEEFANVEPLLEALNAHVPS